LTAGYSDNSGRNNSQSSRLGKETAPPAPPFCYGCGQQRKRSVE